MSKQQKLIPELRFPEFKNEKEWGKKVLGSLGRFLGGGTPERSNSNYWIGDIPWVSSSDINDDDIRNISISRFINDDAIKQSATKIIPQGSVLFVSRVGVGKLAINKVELCTSQDFTNFVPGKNISNFFIAYYFSSNKNLLQSFNQGTSIKGFSKNDLENLELPHPENFKEQQKIASCLSSLDEVITAHSQKLELLKEYKKGLMQNLFPQDGEKVPKVRFKEFEKDGEWVEKSLESLTTKISDGIHTTPLYDDSGEYYFINGNNLIDGKIWIDDKTKRVSEEEYYRHKRDLSESTILLSINGTIGNMAVFNNEKVILGKSACYINVNETKVDKTFTIYFIQTESIKSYFHSELTGSTIKNLSLKSIKAAIIKVPNKFNEQQKIASCLSALDELITVQADKIEQLKLHKKGLMQGLFPQLKD